MVMFLLLSLSVCLNLLISQTFAYNLCDWSSWDVWTDCSKTCGGGLRWRNRGIWCRTPSSFFQCLKDCDADYFDSHERETCNTYCHNGIYDTSDHRCMCNIFYEGTCCEKVKPSIEEPNGARACNDVCNWTPWASWSECSVSCGGGGWQQRERRLCCLEEYGGFENCAVHCAKETTDYLQKRKCGDNCLNGGTLNPNGLGCQCLNRTFGHCCEQLLPGCTPFPTDVIFLLDSSVSQSEKQFRAQLEFVTKFVDRVNISAEEFQVAVITYSTEVKTNIAFNQSVDNDVLKSLIRKIRFRPGATFTDKGLKSAMEVARESERRMGMVTLTYAIVLTDGMSNNRKKTRIAAKELRDHDVHVIVIGIGKEVSHQELVDIASPGDEFSPSYVFSVGDFNALDTLLKQLVHATCEDCSAISDKSDIVFLLDESNGMSEAEFQISLNVMTSVVKSTGHVNEENGQNIGVVQFGNTLKREIEFSNNVKPSKLILTIQTLIRQSTWVCAKNEECTVRNITTAIDNTIEYFFNSNGRNDSRKFLIVMSNVRFENVDIVREEMIKLNHGSNFKVFVIGPGIDVDMRGLLSLAKEANHVYVMLESDDPSKLDIMQSEFSYNVCK